MNRRSRRSIGAALGAAPLHRREQHIPDDVWAVFARFMLDRRCNIKLNIKDGRILG